MSSLVGSEDSGIEGGSGVERLVYFSDAVFAIAITLLALEIRLPEMHDPTPRELGDALLGLLPQFYGFAISFWIIAVYWLAHHRIFRYIRAYDRRLQVINFLFLMWIVLMPFSASLLGGYGSYQLAEVVYFSHMILTSLSMALLCGATRPATGSLLTPTSTRSWSVTTLRGSSPYPSSSCSPSASRS